MMQNSQEPMVKPVSDRETVENTHEYTVQGCYRRVNDAMKWRKNAGFDEKWAKIIKLYANQYEYDELSGYDDIVAPNMMFSTANVIVPSVMVNYPKITVSARRPEDGMNARIVEAVSNYYWQHYDFQEEVKMLVKDFVVLGHGIAKVTWILEEEEVDVPRDEWIQNVQDMLLQVEQSKMNAPEGVSFPTEDEIIASVPTTKMVASEDHPCVERVSPFDVYVDPDATRLKNARWIAQRIYMPLEEAVENEVYAKKARKKLRGTAMSQAKKDYDLTFSGEERGRDADFVVVWEYYDLLEETMCTFAEGCDEFLIPPTEFPYPFGHPFVFIMNHMIPEKLYPMGDLESIVPLQIELALTRTQMINDRKRYRRMYMYKPDEIGPDGLAALLSSDDNAMIPIDSDSPFGDIIAPIGTTALPPEFYSQTAMILDDMDRTSAVTEYQRGSASEIRRTATEASMIQDMSNARSADKLATIERGISEIAQRCVQLAQEFLSTEQVAKIVSSDGQTDWVPYTKDDVEGEFDFSVEAGSTQPQNESFRRQSAMQLLDAMAPFISAGVVDPAKLAEHVLRNGFGIQDTSAFIMQQPPPQPEAPAGPQGMPPQGAMPPEQGMPPQDMMMGAPQDMQGQLPPEMMAALAAGQQPPMG